MHLRIKYLLVCVCVGGGGGGVGRGDFVPKKMAIVINFEGPPTGFSTLFDFAFLCSLYLAYIWRVCMQYELAKIVSTRSGRQQMFNWGSRNRPHKLELLRDCLV